MIENMEINVAASAIPSETTLSVTNITNTHTTTTNVIMTRHQCEIEGAAHGSNASSRMQITDKYLDVHITSVIMRYEGPTP